MGKQKTKKNNPFDGGKQLAIGEVVEEISSGKKRMTADEIFGVLAKVARVFKKTVKREEEAEKRRQEEEKRLQEQKAKEEEALHIQQVTSMDLPLDWENLFEEDTRATGVHVDTSADALVLSQRTLGRVDIEYMSAITGKSCKQIIEDLGDAIYQNPETWGECFYKGWETADEYLTGNLSKKWSIAQDANKKYNGYFKRNLKAISNILPPSVSTKDIYITLGSPWVPTDVIDDFIVHLFGQSSVSNKGNSLNVRHDELTGTWDIPVKSRYWDARVYNIYGTKRISAMHILERTLNMKNIVVTDEVACHTTKSGVKRVVNKEETLLAVEKQKKLIEEFQQWVWVDKRRKQRLEEIFDDLFGCVRVRRYDGSFLEFPGMAEDVKLYPYQKNAIARILFSKNTLLAHDVGAGKTYVMIAAGMELIRMGLSKKNLYVVPNNIVGQWHTIFKRLYPQANVFCVEPSNFTVDRREKTLRYIRDNTFDGIIMAASCFDMLKISYLFEEEVLREEKKLVDALSKTLEKNTSGVEKRKKKLQEKLNKLLGQITSQKRDICFDELGVTRLFVDEAHNYKNLPIETKIDRVLGLNTTGSDKCKEMLDKVKCVQRQNGGGGVIMATGTPITNSITDAYVMQSYLQSGELAALDLQSFDAWVGMFAERSTEFEIDVDTNSYRLATRFSKFHNLPELTALLSSIADFHQVRAGEHELPDFDGYEDSLVGRTEEFKAYLATISKRADAVRQGGVRRRDDNMLKITTDGRKAALDLRLVDQSARYTYQSKVSRCADRVSDIYSKTSQDKRTQLIFCDSSTPKDGFNIYDELTSLLVGMGVPRAEIAYVHDATTEKKREALFKRVRLGEIRVLIGSTFKLGLGVNIQDRLIAVHHLDIPWRPADMVQREGRILRQGNQNKKVHIYRYVTEGSFDAYSWQLLETKQNFISALLDGSMKDRSGSDVDDTSLNYAEIKALAIGDPLIKKRVETVNELHRFLSLQRKWMEAREGLEVERRSMPERLAKAQKRIDECKADIAHYEKNQVLYSKEIRNTLRERIFAAVQDNHMQPEERLFMHYQGFELLLPANMLIEKPHILLRATGTYYVELGDTAKGVMMRIDNFLDGMKSLLFRFENNLSGLKEHEKYVEAELAKTENYAEEIERIRNNLQEIDEKLGVKKSA